MNWQNNKWIWIGGGIILFNLLLFGASELIVRRTTNKVIERLQKEYSPSMYSPGLDPDKINPDALRRRAEFVPDENSVVQPIQPTPVKEKEKPKEETKVDWATDWELQRKN